MWPRRRNACADVDSVVLDHHEPGIATDVVVRRDELHDPDPAPVARPDRLADLERVDPGHTLAKAARDVFVYFIHEGKVRAPAAAMALIERLK